MSAIRPAELESMMHGADAPIVLDVRPPEEFAAGSIPGARNLSWSDDIAERLAAELPKETPIVLVCTWGHRSVVASISLRRAGFRRVFFLDGGLESWGLAGKPVVRAAGSAAATLVR